MTAISFPAPLERRSPSPRRPAPGTTASWRPAAATRPRPGARPSAAVFRRRRAAVCLVVAVLLGVLVAVGMPGEAPLSLSGRAPAAAEPAGALPIAARSYVVQPGDTLWSIARSLQPHGDVRPLVQRLAADRGGAPLRAGERLVLPPGAGGRSP
ncbi:MAG TPA: LysM domain-containing protein [Acidimicrobiales bacterium]|nr:LysM domain-containing protein [Acidimicrobiales bacterium]